MQDSMEAGRRITGVAPTPPTLPVADAERAGVLRRLRDAGYTRGPLVVVSPSAGHAIRRWPAERFAAVLRSASGSVGFLVVVVDPGDPAAPEVECPEGVSGMVWASDLWSLRGLLSEADVVLCCDSGVMHIAGAVGSRVVAVFGPTSPSWYGPHSAKDRIVVRRPMPCRPCFDRCLFDEPVCMPVETSDVRRALEDVLARGRTHRAD